MITSLSGSDLRFVEKNDVKVSMDNAMKELENEGFIPLYIYGGGHCIEGSYAYYEACKELKTQMTDEPPDYIVVASGTGTTQAGLEIGVRSLFPDCKVLGVSVSREAEKGKAAIKESMIELNNFLGNPIDLQDEIFFDDTKMGLGYEAVFPELIQTIKFAATKLGIVLDPTYTGKAFYAMMEYIKNGTIKKNAKVVFWHTGGLLNLMASEKI
jgi:1-aminocyclopropane-1-carboxylate deaminase/D-cysteine desulfhydrase-like pyridoxal-dependent ACC family enzyme